MPQLKPITKNHDLFTAGIAKDRVLFTSTKLKTILSKSAILFLVLLIASLSTLVFSRTSFWTTNLVNLSIDNDFTLFVDVTNNRVGINTSDPTATLQVNGSVRVVPLASCNTIDTDANGLMSCGTDDAGGGASPVINSSEYVFINDTFPKAVNLSNLLFVNGSLGRVGIGTTTPGSVLSVTGNFSTTTGALLATSSGNVGIGTTSPQNTLDVEGAVAIGATYSGTNAAPANGLIVEGRVGIGVTSSNIKLAIGDSWIGFDNPAANTLGMYTNSAERMRINGDGNVGIGTTSPGSARLNVSGNISITGHPNNTGIIFADGTFLKSAGHVSRMRVHGTGTQSITTDTTTRVNWNQISFDTNNEFDITSDNFTAKDAGYYLAESRIWFDSIADQKTMRVYFYVNSVTNSSTRLLSSGTLGLVVGHTDLLKLEKGDAVDVRVDHFTGSSITISLDSPFSHFAVHRLS